ncbi:MAG: L,D-transpeptidase, partial [Pseudomonadota bacterium]
RFLFSILTLIVTFVVTPSYAAYIEARVDLSQQKMRVYKGGKLKYSFKISSGRKGFRTPTGRWGATRMYRKYYSKKYHGAPMPNSIFFYRGYAIHGTNKVSRLGRPASHGCIRLAPGNARALYNLVRANGRRNFRVSIRH